MVPGKKTDDSKALWIAGVLLALLCAACWFCCWRTDQTLWIYFLSPFVSVTMVFLIGGLAACGVQIGLNRPKLSVHAIALTLSVVGLILLREGWPELAWGAPRLKSVIGSELLFADGKMHRLPIKQITAAGIRELAEHKGKRMTLAALRLVATSLVLDGLAQAGESSLEWAEQDAKINKYGIWGGGSYDADLEEYERLKLKLGVDDHDKD